MVNLLCDRRDSSVNTSKWKARRTNSGFLGCLLCQPPMCLLHLIIGSTLRMWPRSKAQGWVPGSHCAGPRLSYITWFCAKQQGTKCKPHLKQCFENVPTTSLGKKWIYSVSHSTRGQVFAYTLLNELHRTILTLTMNGHSDHFSSTWSHFCNAGFCPLNWFHSPLMSPDP